MIFYLCDGKNNECTKESCYLNGGDCRHTSNIKNAKNFKENISGYDVFEVDYGIKMGIDEDLD